MQSILVTAYVDHSTATAKGRKFWVNSKNGIVYFDTRVEWSARGSEGGLGNTQQIFLNLLHRENTFFGALVSGTHREQTDDLEWQTKRTTYHAFLSATICRAQRGYEWELKFFTMCGVRVGKNPINLPLIVWLPFVYIGVTVDSEFSILLRLPCVIKYGKLQALFACSDRNNLEPN